MEVLENDGPGCDPKIFAAAGRLTGPGPNRWNAVFRARVEPQTLNTQTYRYGRQTKLP